MRLRDMNPGGAARQVASRLKYPQLLALTATLFALDLMVPDLIPFVDEILLGLATTLFATWRERTGVAGAGKPGAPHRKPPEKNVTPPG